MDNRLTDGLGSSLFHEIKSNELTKDIPVLLVSGDSGLPALALEPIADAYLAKPSDLNELVRLVKTWSGEFEDIPDPDTFEGN